MRSIDFKAFFSGFLAMFFPKRCVACGELLEFDYRDCLCPDCREEWDEAKVEICEVCGKTQTRCRCAYGKEHVDMVRHLAAYDHNKREGVANRIVYNLKKSNYNVLFLFVADEMANELVDFKVDENTVVAGVPRSPGSVRRYGYDHAKKLARVLAERLEVGYLDALGHYGGKQEQKTLNKSQRALNAKENCYLKNGVGDSLKGKTVLLVDDIITTGAMTGACAEQLHLGGAKRVICLLAAKNRLDKEAKKK